MAKSNLALLSSLILSGAPVLAQNPFCTNAVYKALASGVAGFAPASSYCYSKFPLPIATQTNTAPTITVTTTVATNTLTTTASTEIDTIATQTTAVATITNVVATNTITEQSTVTETTMTGLMNKRFAPRAATSKTSTTSTSTKVSGQEAAFSSLVAGANSVIGQVCTCLETQATTTVTKTPTATAQATASATSSVTATTFVTLTVQATSTQDATTTTTTTSVATTTVAVCAPTFSRAASASNGQQYRIEDNRFFCAGTYQSAADTIFGVTAQQCYDACAANGNCAAFTYSTTYDYCEQKTAGNYCYCPSSDFIAGIKV